MKDCRISAALILLVILLAFNSILFGFGNKVTHPAISSESIDASTADDYLKNNIGLSRGIQTELQYDADLYNFFIRQRMYRGNFYPDMTKRTVFGWLRAGSVIEDEDGYRFPIRARHHFHDPLHNAGLEDKTDYPNYSQLFAWVTHIYSEGFDVTGQSAIIWAISGEAQQEPFDNFECWERARYDFHRAISETERIRREEFFADAFMELGSVMHLIEDMGVPAHARNDFLFGHYQPPKGIGNAFENWVEGVIKNNSNQCPWSGSLPVVFDKLVKYFDANEYLGGYLGNGILPPDMWGLSECSNYQFLSLSTMFGCTGEKYQFPNPAKEHLGADLPESVPEGIKLYFNGSNYGVAHIARKSYT